MAGDLPEPVKHAVADRWIADSARHRTPVAVVTNVATDLQRAKLHTARLAGRLPVVVGVDLAGPQ